MYKKPKFDYDKDADVMYILFGKPEPCKSTEDQPGIVIRKNLAGELRGITIIDYIKRTDKTKRS